MLTSTKLKELADDLRKIVRPNSKVKYNAVDRYWEVRYEEGDSTVTDSYKLTANRGWMRFSTIKTEI